VPVRVAYDHHIGAVEKRRASGIEIGKELEECRSKSATQRRALFYDLLKRRVAPRGAVRKP